MTERLTLEEIFRNSVGGGCDFIEAEKLKLPVNPNLVRVTKRVRGNMGEERRFKKLIQEMVKSGLLTKAQSEEKWAKVK